MPVLGDFTASHLVLAGACDLSSIQRVLNVEHDLHSLCMEWGLTKVAGMLHDFEADVLSHRIPVDPNVSMQHFLQNNCANDYHILRWHDTVKNIHDYVLHTKAFYTLPSWLQTELKYGLDHLVNQTNTFFTYTGLFNPNSPSVVPTAATKALASIAKRDPAVQSLQDKFLHPNFL
jgi:hypothetical protein